MTPNPEFQNIQKIFENVRAEGNITVGNITQIYHLLNNLGDIPKPTGFPQNIPNSSTDKFVGRETELKSLQQQLQRNHKVVIAAIEGMGGVGKTELAIQYSLLHLQLQNYSGGICWLQAREQDIGLQIINFARTDLGLNPPDDLELPERVRWCWNHWNEGNTLIVLDDVINYGDIKSYLPPQPSQFKVLITTRLKLDFTSSLYLEVLQEADALQLLTQLVGEEKVDKELEKAKELCQRLGYLPLALQLVGQYFKKRKTISLSEMLRRLENKGLGHPSLLIKENDPTWTLNIKRGVEAAFELSWSELSIFAQELGCLLSLFAFAPIPWSLVESTAVEQDSEELEDARIELETSHLLEGEDIYQVHQLIREFFQKKLAQKLSPNYLKQAFVEAMIAIAKEIPEKLSLKDVQNYTPIIPHIAEVIINEKILKDSTILSDKNFCWPFVSLSRFYDSQELYEEIKPWYEKQILVSIERFGENHLEVASSYNNLARLYDNLRYYIDAEEYYYKAIDICETLLEVNHLYVATILNNLALLYSSPNLDTESKHHFENRCTNLFEKSKDLLYQALVIRENNLEENHPDIAESLNNIGMLYVENYSYEEAEKFLKKALEIRRSNYGTRHPKFAESLNNLAYLYKKWHYYNKISNLYVDTNRDYYSEAEGVYFETLSLYRHLFGEEHPNIARAIWDLGELYLIQGEYSIAEDLFVNTVKMLDKCLGTEHRYTVNACQQLQSFCRKV